MTNIGDISKLNILVTGGAGFIGSNIVEYLVKNNVKLVKIFDNLSTGNKQNILPYINLPNVEFVYGDISNLEQCRSVMSNVDVICHQAALGSVPRSIEDPLSTHNSNVTGFLNILIAAHEYGIKRIVYASSSSVYGDSENLPKIEGDEGSLLSPYAASKHINEQYAQIFNRCYNMECIGLRYFNVFGPRQDPNGAYAAVIPKFIDQLLREESPTINGDGTFSRDFTYIDNVVQANILSLTMDISSNRAFLTNYNIGGNSRITINELFNTIKQELCIQHKYSNIMPIYVGERNGDISHSNANISLASTNIKYNPHINFIAGIKKTVEYYIKHI